MYRPYDSPHQPRPTRELMPRPSQPPVQVDLCAVVEPMATRLLPAVMCVTTGGDIRFASSEARRLHAQWDDGLRDAPYSTIQRWSVDRLVPHATELLTTRLRREARDRQEAPPRGLRLQHPYLSELALTVELNDTDDEPHLLVGFVPSSRDHTALARAELERERVLEQLTPSERRVALLVAEGLRNHEIADRIHRSRRTIECQLNAIYRKLDLRGRTQLVRLLG